MISLTIHASNQIGWSLPNGDLTACYVIPAETEITASYIPDLARPIDVRQNELRQQYGFTCTCGQCTAFPAEIETSETKLQRYCKLAPHWDNPDDLSEYDKWCSDYPVAMAELAEAKGILRDERKFEMMGDVLEEMWLVNVYHGRKEGAIRAGREMLGFYAIAEGEAWAREGGWDVKVDQPETMECWRSAISDKSSGSRRRSVRLS